MRGAALIFSLLCGAAFAQQDTSTPAPSKAKTTLATTTTPLAAASQARAQPSAKPVSPIQTQFKAYKVIFLAGGKEELEPASGVSPGEVVEYVALHRNVSGKRLLNTDFAIPIPFGTTLWQGSVQPASGVLKMPSGAGQEGKAVAKGSDRPRVVWRVERLDPGQTVEFKLRVSIDADPTLGTAPAPNPFRPAQPQLRKP